MSADIAKDDRILVDGELVTVVAAAPASAGFECIVKSATRGLFEVFVRSDDVGKYKVPAHPAVPVPQHRPDPRSHILTKLNARSRTQIAQAVPQR